VLKQLVAAVPGAWGAIFVDFEGEAVDLFAVNDAYQVKLAGAHAGLLWNRVREAGMNAGQGASKAVAVLAANLHLFVHAVDKDYFVLLAAKPEAHPGLARHHLAFAVESLKRLL
jgi:predicted regulator of Ras-like GTPase activity (Roadblock/LC7/MglB family)